MRKRIVKTYEQYAVDYELSKGFAGDTQLSKSDISASLKRKYEKLFVDYLLMMDVVDDTTNESLVVVDDVIDAFNKNDFDNGAQSFYDSYNKSKRITFLTPYSVDDIRHFKTYKLRGYNIGFAIKDNGDIILVHNNESKVNGIGDLMINKAIELGGDHLDHFDGFLTGFYKKNGFKLRSNEQFVEEYKPKNWKYERVDIYNTNKSIYVEELKTNNIEFEKAEKRYDSGRPDVVYRVLKK